MDLKQLRYFAAIVDEGGVRRAAERVSISQPALTVAVQKLEAELGVPLFARIGRTVKPTAEGLHFYEHARSLLARAENAKQDMRSLSSLDKAEIRLGAPITIASYMLAEPIASFMENYPGVRVSFTQMSGPTVESALLQGDLDIGVLSRAPRFADIIEHQLSQKQVCSFVRTDHDLVRQGYVTWPQLLSRPIVTLPKSYILFQTLMDQSVRYRQAADIILESDVVPLLVSTLKKSDAVGLLLESVADNTDGLVALPIKEEGGTSNAHDTIVPISACHQKDMHLSIAAKALLSHLENHSW